MSFATRSTQKQRDDHGSSVSPADKLDSPDVITYKSDKPAAKLILMNVVLRLRLLRHVVPRGSSTLLASGLVHRHHSSGKWTMSWLGMQSSRRLPTCG